MRFISSKDLRFRELKPLLTRVVKVTREKVQNEQGGVEEWESGPVIAPLKRRR
jgi:hypothetical protein